MSEAIMMVDGWYFEWSPYFSAPTTCALNADEFEEYVREEYGRRGLESLPERMQRATASGTSMLPIISDGPGQCAQRVIATNRAGLGRTRLTKEQLMEWLMALRDDIDAVQPTGSPQ